MKRLHLILYILLFVATNALAQEPTPNPSRGEGSLITIANRNATSLANRAPLPSGGAGGGFFGGGLLTLDFQKASLAQALDTLRTYTNDYNITFVHNDIEHLQVTLQAQVRSVPEAVELICKSQPVKVKVKDGNIIVKYRPEKDRTIALWGHVRDSFTKHGVLGAKIYMQDENGVVLDSMTTWRPNNDRDDAVYRFEVPIVQRSYRFVAEHPDYETTTIDYTLRYAARNDFFDLPHTFMKKRDVQLNGGDLNEVVITATKVQMVYRGDTLVYNADAFNVPEGSMLDALIRQMPGVELHENGEIYVHGRKVDFLTLNGNDFFRGKNKVMLDNLPYYTVKNIEVYEKQTEKSEWLGVADAPKDFVMDVVLKREYRKGYLANLQGGTSPNPSKGGEGLAGSNPSDEGTRYAAKAFGQRYTDHSYLNVFFNGNNINELNNPGSKGEWSTSKEQREGVADMKKGGMNLSINDKDKRWTEHMNFEISGVRQHKETRSSTEHFLPEGNEYSRDVNSRHYRDFGMGGSNTFTLKKPFWFRNQLGVYYGHNTSRGLERYGRFTQDPSWIGGPVVVLDSAFRYSPELMRVLVNMRNDDNTGSETSWWAEYKPTISYKFLWGDDIDLWGNLYYGGRRQEENNHVLTEGYSSDQRDKELRFDDKTLNWQAGVQYTVHSHSHWNYRASVGYYYHWEKVENEHLLDFSPDPRNTYSYTYNSRRITPTLMVYYQRDNQKRKRSTWFSVSLPLHIEHREIDFRPSMSTPPSEEPGEVSILLPTPAIRYESTYNQGLNYLLLSYNSEYFAPTMINMVNTFFDSDPLNIQLGNDQLETSFKHRFLLNYKLGWKQHNQYLRFDGGVNIHQNQIVRGQTYDPKTGVTYHRFENVRGNWDSWGQLTFGRMLDAKKRLWLETRVGPSYDHNVGIARILKTHPQPLPVREGSDYSLGVSGHTTPLPHREGLGGGSAAGVESVIAGWNLSWYTQLRYTLKKLTLSGYVRYGTSWKRYTIPARGIQTRFHPITTHYGLSGQYELPILRGSDGRGLQVATDAVLYVKRGYGDKSMDTNDFVWNASIAKSLWKNQFVVKLEGFDLLNQLCNIYSTVDAQGRVETWRNMVPSFVMLHLEWHFSRLPKNKR